MSLALTGSSNQVMSRSARRVADADGGGGGVRLIGVDHEADVVADGFAEGCYAADVFGDGEAADLCFHALEAELDVHAGLVEEAGGELAFGVVEAGGVNSDLVSDSAAEQV